MLWDAGKAVLRWRKEVAWADDILARASKANTPKVGCPTSNSFLPGTAVLMADGTSKPIEDVQPGDVVLATDPRTGRTEPKKVTHTIVGSGDKHLVTITIDVDGTAGDHTATVTATDGHPFWVAALDAWIDATDLRSGQWLHTSAGTKVQITAIDRYTQPTRVHNLTVADIHTYYVMAGNTPVLVHNCGGSVDGHRTICDCANGGNPILKRGPKPAGTGAHNQKIADIAGQVDDGTIIGGGQMMPEVSFPTPGGFKSSRRPDILVQRPGGSIYGINVGKQAASGAPIKREAEALWDLEGIGIEMHFVPYN